MLLFLRRLWAFVKPYQTRCVLGLGCGVLFALSNAALIIVIRLVVNVVFPGASGKDVSVAQQIGKLPALIRPIAEGITQWLPSSQGPDSTAGKVAVICAIPAVMLVRAVFGYLNIYLMNWAAVRAIVDLRTRLFAHLHNLSLDFFSSARTGELISRIGNDTGVLQSIIGNTLASMIKDPITLVCLLAVLMTQEPALTLVSIVVLPACVLPILVYGRKMRSSARALQGHIADLSNLMHESFTGARIIKAYNLEEAMLRDFRATAAKYVSHTMRVVRANEIPSQAMELLGGVGVALVFLYVLLARNSHTTGDFISFIGSIFLMYQPIKSLTRLNNQLEQARAASHRVFELLDAVSSVVDPSSPLLLKAAGADIHFQSIDFSYGEKPVLRGIDLKIKAGQLVALVGTSGSGKTTLTNLLLRFYDPQKGAVRIGGLDIRQVSLHQLRRQVALVAQETILFNDTVRNNIAMGRPGASDAEIEATARHAFAHDFIMETPKGYETVIGEKGALLSMGQRQRLTIARALLKDAPILVLDEATSALDSESERAVQAALDELMQGRTTICIAHRLSTIQKADLIVVLSSGRIVETGTHEELLRARGAYCKLYALQFEAAMA